MKVLITGATGLLGRALCVSLIRAGHEVIRVTRSPHLAMDLSWSDPFPPVDCAIHLAGQNLSCAIGHWDKPTREKLLRSRIDTAKILRDKLTPDCRLIITASGANAYAADGTIHDENSATTSHSFLGRLCGAWEDVWSALPWQPRVVAMRMGVILAAEGGVLPRLAGLARWGLAGRIGDGRQRMSWVSLADAVRAYEFVLAKQTLVGPVNVVSPAPIAQADFAKDLGAAVGCPFQLPAPAWAVKFLGGPLAKELLLDDCAVVPAKLLNAGFVHAPPHLAQTLASLLNPKQ